MNVPLDKRIRIERPVTTKGTNGAPMQTWECLAVVWASLQDVLPSRSESLQGGNLQMARNQTRIRFRFRRDVTSAMRIIANGRTLQIIGGPAELGQHEYIEVMCEVYSS